MDDDRLAEDTAGNRWRADSPAQDGRGTFRSHGAKSRRRGDVDLVKAIWSQPPSWLYLPSQGIGTGDDFRPVALFVSPSGSASGSQSSRRSTARVGVADASTLGASASSDRVGEEELAAANIKIAARNASIAISLADHAERVARKRARGVGAATQTAAERIEALRRRVNERRNVDATADVAVEATTGGAQSLDARIGNVSQGCAVACSNGEVLETSDAPASIEDEQMHLYPYDVVDTAAISVGEEVEAGGISLASSTTSGGGGSNTAAACAAAAWAQHAVPLGGTDDEERHLRED